MLWKMKLKPLTLLGNWMGGSENVDTNIESKPPRLSQQSPKPLSMVSVPNDNLDRFACQIIFAHYPTMELIDRFEEYGARVIGTIPDLDVKCDERHDIFEPLVMEDESLKDLPEGIYLAFIQGTVHWESNINPEFGTDDGDWVFAPDNGYPHYTPLSVKPKEVKHDK